MNLIQATLLIPENLSIIFEHLSKAFDSSVNIMKEEKHLSEKYLDICDANEQILELIKVLVFPMTQRVIFYTIGISVKS